MSDIRFLDQIKEAEAMANARLEDARLEIDERKKKAREDSDAMVANAWSEAERKHSDIVAHAESQYRKLLSDAAKEDYTSSCLLYTSRCV